MPKGSRIASPGSSTSPTTGSSASTIAVSSGVWLLKILSFASA